ncbi:unnamed protein product [Alopecurus aequalis]
MNTSAPAVRCAAAASLPDDIIFDVLCRLPVKSLCRFRCASKGWYVLVSDPAFVAAHRSCHSKPLVVVSSMSDDNDGHDLRLMDMDGNVVRAIEGLGGTGLVSTSMDNLICVTDDSCGGARVVDPAKGDVLAECPKLRLEPKRDVFAHYEIPIFGFGRAFPSGQYKVVSVILPVKSVCRLRCVSRGWYALISDPTFVAAQRSRHAEPLVVAVTSSGARGSFDVQLMDMDSNVVKVTKDVIGSGHGSGLLSTSTNDFICVTKDSYYDFSQVIDPATGKSELGTTNIWLMTDSDNDIWIKMYTVPMVFFNYGNYLRVTRDGDGDRLIFCFASSQGKGNAIHDPHKGTCVALPGLCPDAVEVGLCSLHLDRFISAKI